MTTRRAPTSLRALTYCTLRGSGIGLKTGEGILDVARTARALRVKAPATVDDVIAGREVEGLWKVLAAGAKAVRVAEKDAQFGPCLTAPEKIIVLGFNYRRHAMEVGVPIPKAPVLFNKYNNSLNGHGGQIKLPAKVAGKFDYEVELQVVIGKTSDGFMPVGPWLVGAELVGDPQKLALECRVNGEQRQSSNTSDMIFSCAQIISYISQVFTLRPGDLISTGTPEGVIVGKPEAQQVWLKAGDKIACSVEKLGELRFELV